MSATVTVTEDVTVKIQNFPVNVFDTLTVTEDITPKLICLIKSVTTTGSFGTTAKGGTETWFSGNQPRLAKATSGNAGTIASITIYLKQYPDKTPKIKCAIYDSSFNLLTNGTTEEKTITNGQDSELTFNFSTPPTVSATTEYRLAFWSDDTIYGYRETGDADEEKVKALTYNGWPDPIEGLTKLTSQWTIYATYATATTGPVETITVSESVSMAGVSNVNVYDSATVTDVDAVQLLTLFNLAVNDSLTVTEDVSTPKLSYRPSVYDTVTITELISTIASLGDISVSENVTVTESIVACLVNLISTSDSVTISEFVSSVASIGGISVYDAVTIIEKLWMDLWMERDKETDTWDERTKENDEDDWDERTKEDDEDAWDERENKETG